MADAKLMNTEMFLTAVSGTSYPENYDHSEGFGSVSIDSRLIEPGSVFFALPGTQSDGHKYVESAFSKGARMAVIEKSRYDRNREHFQSLADSFDGLLIVVESSLRALQDAAAVYLNMFPKLLRVGITGSSGKTTTKELAAAMIAGERKVVMNKGNLNSETGLPLSVFAVRKEHEVGVFEMGMNRVGEIAELARVLRPHVALITNIGSAHIGILGTKDAIAEEKKKIFSCFTGSEVALIPENDSYAAYLADGVQGRIRSFGPESVADFNGYQDLGLHGLEIQWGRVDTHFPVPGAYNVMNILAAAAIAQEAGIQPYYIRKGIENFKPLFGRGELIDGPITILQDCYNANPDSMAAAINLCNSLDLQKRRIYVIGSMMELGSASEKAHEQIGELLAVSKADIVCLYGPETCPAKKAWLSSFQHFPLLFQTEDMDSLIAFLQSHVQCGDFILLKGSRAAALERISEALQDHFAHVDCSGQKGA